MYSARHMKTDCFQNPKQSHVSHVVRVVRSLPLSNWKYLQLGHLSHSNQEYCLRYIKFRIGFGSDGFLECCCGYTVIASICQLSTTELQSYRHLTFSFDERSVL